MGERPTGSLPVVSQGTSGWSARGGKRCCGWYRTPGGGGAFRTLAGEPEAACTGVWSIPTVRAPPCKGGWEKGGEGIALARPTGGGKGALP